MKLQELSQNKKTQTASRVIESHFGTRVRFENIDQQKARSMLAKVRGLIAEHRSQSDFHVSEQNPSYLKLLFMEQGLAARISETEMIAVDMNDPKTKTALDKAAKGQIS